MKQRIIQPDLTATIQGTHTVAYHSESTPWVAKLYAGRSAKPLLYSRFNSQAHMMQIITETQNRVETNMAANELEKQARREAKKGFDATEHIQVGTILCESGGWEQTNVYFYKVTAVTKGMVKVQPMTSSVVDGSEMAHGMACDVVAGEVRTDRPEESFRVVGRPNNEFVINPGGHWWTGIWSGSPKYCSWYA